MDRNIAFIIEAYVKKNGIILGEIRSRVRQDIHQYLNKHNLLFNENQMLILGRACMSFTSKDILITSKNNKILPYKFHLYGKEMDFISEASTCVIICSLVEDEFNVGDKLILYTESEI